MIFQNVEYFTQIHTFVLEKEKKIFALLKNFKKNIFVPLFVQMLCAIRILKVRYSCDWVKFLALKIRLKTDFSIRNITLQFVSGLFGL